MVEQARETDLGIGLAFVFGAIAVLAALATTVTSLGGGTQLVSGLAIAVAMLASGLAVAAIHVFQ